MGQVIVKFVKLGIQVLDASLKLGHVPARGESASKDGTQTCSGKSRGLTGQWILLSNLTSSLSEGSSTLSIWPAPSPGIA